MSRQHRRKTKHGKLTTVGKATGKEDNQHFPVITIPPLKLSPPEKEKDTKLNKLDHDVLALYVGMPPEDITPNKIVPKKVIQKINTNLKLYPFWGTLSEDEKTDITNLYRDYYLTSLLIRAYNNAYLLIIDSRVINNDLKSQYRTERQKLIQRKLQIDQQLLKEISKHQKSAVPDLPKKKNQVVRNAIRDIIRDLEEMKDHDFTEAAKTSDCHTAIIALIDRASNQLEITEVII